MCCEMFAALMWDLCFRGVWAGRQTHNSCRCVFLTAAGDHSCVSGLYGLEVNYSYTFSILNLFVCFYKLKVCWVSRYVQYATNAVGRDCLYTSELTIHNLFWSFLKCCFANESPHTDYWHARDSSLVSTQTLYFECVGGCDVISPTTQQLHRHIIKLYIKQIGRVWCTRLWFIQQAWFLYFF